MEPDRVVAAINLVLLVVVVIQSLLIVGLVSQHKARITDLQTRTDKLEGLHNNRRT